MPEESDRHVERPPREHPQRRHLEWLTEEERELFCFFRTRNLSPDIVIDMLTEFKGADRTAHRFCSRAERPRQSNGLAKAETKRTSMPKKTA
jgi:hypothetical protein